VGSVGLSRPWVSSVIAWPLLVIGLVLYGAGGRYAPYLVLGILPFAVAHLILARALRPKTANLAALGFVAAFVLLTLAFALSAEQPSDVWIAVNFSWFLFFIPLQSEFERIAWPSAGVAFARLALLGTIVTLGLAIYERVATGTDRVGVLTSDPIRIANTAVILGFLSLSGMLADRGWRRPIYLLGPLLALAVALLAGTRGAVAAICVMIVLAPLLATRSWRVSALVATGLAVLAIVFLVTAAQLQIPRLETIARTISELIAGAPVSDMSVAIRLSLLAAAWNAFLQSPWVGHGWDDLMSAIAPFLPPNWDTQGSPHLHNDIADFAVAGGLLGLLAYAMILVAPVVAAARSTRDSLHDVRLFAVLLLVASYAVLWVNSLMFGFEIHTSLYCIVCAAILGFLRDG
jgi:O-antigen ligase